MAAKNKKQLVTLFYTRNIRRWKIIDANLFFDRNNLWAIN